MQIESTSFPTHGPDQNVLHKAYFAEQICLVVAVQIVLINLLARAFPFVHNLLPESLLHMRVFSTLAVLCATLALFFTEERRYLGLYRTGKILAGLVALTAAICFWGNAAQTLANFDQFLNRDQMIQSHAPLPTTAFAFVLLGIVVLLLPARDSIFGRIADAGATILVLLVLIILSQYVFTLARIPEASTRGLPSIPTTICIALLTHVCILRRAKYGIFSVFLGDGIGGRVARILAPILLLMPFLRELGRARLLSAHLFPTPYATAILASVATIISFVFLLVLVRLMNNMQSEIHGLTLRDELTGLYNFRGFNLFADQAFRLARRARTPFGVLFIDMDNLKIINDELGHSAGSVSLVETAKLLTATFRETDVIGRLGGDEFVVAGQFDPEEISVAIERIRTGAAAKTQLAGSRFFLSLSMGYAGTDHSTEETLKSIISRADKAMYKEKRAKKRIA
jgi:diguanylate cyclase (GGDEF)-like protein